jgi:hypothetical protein
MPSQAGPCCSIHKQLNIVLPPPSQAKGHEVLSAYAAGRTGYIAVRNAARARNHFMVTCKQQLDSCPAPRGRSRCAIHGGA